MLFKQNSKTKLLLTTILTVTVNNPLCVNVFAGFDECKRQSEPLICPLCRTWWKETNVEAKG